MICLENYRLKELELKNRIVLPPMCLFQAGKNGLATSFHKTHYEARAIGGVGLIILEATAVHPNGRISENDLGLWNNKQIPGLREIAYNCKKHGSRIAIQLGHAGRKADLREARKFAPSVFEDNDTYGELREASKEEIKEIVQSFQDAASRAVEAGFDAIEIHGAHGYLIHQFLSPLSNKRTDAYGGSLENRSRFLKEILEAVDRVTPNKMPIILRLSADDYLDGGLDIDETIEIVNNVKPFIDMVHLSSGGLLPAEIELYPGYQVKYAQAVKEKCGLPTIAVGLIEDLEFAERVLEEDRADLVAMGRKLLREPQYILNEIHYNEIEYEFPAAYRTAYK